jgi:hypothetical protein
VVRWVMLLQDSVRFCNVIVQQLQEGVLNLLKMPVFFFSEHFGALGGRWSKPSIHLGGYVLLQVRGPTTRKAGDKYHRRPRTPQQPRVDIDLDVDTRNRLHQNSKYIEMPWPQKGASKKERQVLDLANERQQCDASWTKETQPIDTDPASKDDYGEEFRSFEMVRNMSKKKWNR